MRRSRPALTWSCLVAEQGRAWFDENLAALTALVRLAETEGLLRHCWQLARACWHAQFEGGHLDELIETHTHRSARRRASWATTAAVAMMLNYLASAYFRLGRFPEAIRLMERALDVCRRLGLRERVPQHPRATWASRTPRTATSARLGES